MLKRFTVRTWYCKGTKYRFTPCKIGQMLQFAWSTFQYVCCSLSLGLPPSIRDRLDKSTLIIMGANTSWSAATRAMRVCFGVDRLTWFWRNWNHLVAVGPNTTAWITWSLNHQEACQFNIQLTPAKGSYAHCAGDIMADKTFLFYTLLCQKVSYSKEALACLLAVDPKLSTTNERKCAYCSGQTLHQYRTLQEVFLVPATVRRRRETEFIQETCQANISLRCTNRLGWFSTGKQSEHSTAGGLTRWLLQYSGR